MRVIHDNVMAAASVQREVPEGDVLVYLDVGVMFASHGYGDALWQYWVRVPWVEWRSLCKELDMLCADARVVPRAVDGAAMVTATANAD